MAAVGPDWPTVPPSKHRAGKRSPRSIARICRGSKPAYSALPAGAHSLESIAMRHILCNLDKIDAQCLSTLPDMLVKKLWTAICRFQLNSLESWQMFAESTLGTRNFVRNWHISGGDLRRYHKNRVDGLYALASSPSFTWLTNLSISTEHLPPTALAKLVELSNLRRVHIAELPHARPISVLTNDIVQGWARAAEDCSAFSKLDLLILYNCKLVTAKCLDSLSCFQGLREVCAHGCGIRVSSNRVLANTGWKKVQASFADYIHASSGKGLYYTWPEMVNMYFFGSRAASLEEIDDRPLLNMYVADAKGRTFIHMDGVMCFRWYGNTAEDSNSDPDGERVEDEHVLKKRKVTGKLIKFEG